MCLLIAAAHAQQVQKKVFPFHGRVEQMDRATKRLTVHNEPIEGWMGEMTMGYRVDDDAVLNCVRLDRIAGFTKDPPLNDVARRKRSTPAWRNRRGGTRGTLKMAFRITASHGQAQTNLQVAPDWPGKQVSIRIRRWDTTEMKFGAAI